jgi:hypothetical protein
LGKASENDEILEIFEKESAYPASQCKLKWYADASFAVHPDFKSHTGAFKTMGKGAVQLICRKQKMNL